MQCRGRGRGFFKLPLPVTRNRHGPPPADEEPESLQSARGRTVAVWGLSGEVELYTSGGGDGGGRIKTNV
jgi:hypothetical protein